MMNPSNSCRIHDLLRDVAIQKAKEDDFLVVCATPDGVQSCCRVRRVAVHNLTGNKLTKFENPNLRTLLCFNSYIPDCSGHRLLKVSSNKNRSFQTLTVSDPPNMKHLEGLSQLRYLELNVGSIMWNQRSFEKLIGCLKFLQTLDFQLFNVGSLPDCIWKIKTMRHVLLHQSTYMSELPPITNLTNLQTLRGVKCLESWKHNNIPNLPNLSLLSIEITRGVPCSEVAAFLHTLQKLAYLAIKGENIPIVDMRGFPFYQYLTGLRYEGTLLCQGFDVAMFPIHLTVISFDGSKLRQDHVAELEKLHGLKLLQLINAYPNQTMRCSAGGFPKLQIMNILLLKELENWEIEDGALPVLNKIMIQNCSMLQVPQGLQYLTALAKFSRSFHGDDLALSRQKRSAKCANTCPPFLFTA